MGEVPLGVDHIGSCWIQLDFKTEDSLSASKSAILLEKISDLAFSRDFRRLAAAIAQVFH